MENKKYLQGIRDELEQIYKGEATSEEKESKSFYDYICDDVLDYDFTLNSQKELTGVRLWVILQTLTRKVKQEIFVRLVKIGMVAIMPMFTPDSG